GADADAGADEGLEDAGALGGEDKGGEVDPLAPELPKGPEPGSPEADAELAALLDESEITQEEFDAAFRGGGPRVDGDALLFGAGDRTRKRPKISFGKVTATAGKVEDEALRALVKADIEQLEACHAMALTKDPGQLGAAKLRLRYDKAGKVVEAEILQETPKLSEALCACLSSVAEGWTLAAAKGATVELPLALSTQ
ncbi:MAG: hypothetical protein KC457_08685, partial [Myxococcales bacterium]|nr:hypothetical protein [Myxococcales bacterium]